MVNRWALPALTSTEVKEDEKSTERTLELRYRARALRWALVDHLRAAIADTRIAERNGATRSALVRLRHARKALAGAYRHAALQVQLSEARDRAGA
jgi:hypothetical protein